MSSCTQECDTWVVGMRALHALKHGCHQYFLKEIPACHHCYKWFVLGDRELAIFIAERCPVVSSSVTDMLTASVSTLSVHIMALLVAQVS